MSLPPRGKCTCPHDYYHGDHHYIGCPACTLDDRWDCYSKTSVHPELGLKCELWPGHDGDHQNGMTHWETGYAGNYPAKEEQI